MSDRRLSPADACWLYSDFEGNHQTVSALLWTDEEIDPDEFRTLVLERLLAPYPTFTQRIRKSRNPLLMPHWEDDPDFDLDAHLKVIRLAEPGDKPTLEKLVSEQRSKMLDHTKPLWEIFLIQGYRGGSAIHARIQHAVADGWALVRLVMSLADQEEGAPKVQVADKPQRERKRDRAKEAARDAVSSAKDAVEDVTESASRAVGAVAGAVRNPRSVPARLASGADALSESLELPLDRERFLEFGSRTPDLVSGAAESVAEQVGEQMEPITEAVETLADAAGDALDYLNSPKPGKTIFHGKVSGEKKVDWLEPRPLSPLKLAGKILGATINDMVLGAVTNALRMYLLEEDSLNVDDLLVAMPISLRSPDQPLPRTLGNRFGLVNVLLPVGIEDPVEQVRNIKGQIDQIKDSQLPVVSFGLVSVAALTTPDVERLIHKITQDQSTGVVTNVPGPRTPIKLAGKNVLGAWGMGGVGGNMNICVGIFTLNGQVNFSICSDTAITPNPERILHHIPEAVDILVGRAEEA